MTLEELRQQYRDRILALAEQYKAENVRVFGSVARGEAGPGSDVDFLVHFKPGATLLDNSALNNRIEELLHVTADVLSDRGIHPAFQQRILNEAVPL